MMVHRRENLRNPHAISFSLYTHKPLGECVYKGNRSEQPFDYKVDL